MALKIEFEKYGDETVYNAQSPTFVLMTRSGERIGILKPSDEQVKSYLNSADEVSFRVYKEVDQSKEFFSQPETPYQIGDKYYVNYFESATAGRAIAGSAVVGRRFVTYVCTNTRLSGAFDINDWSEGIAVDIDVWNRLTDFKLMWCREWNKLFEIYVESNDGDGVSKFVTGTSLGEAELGQILLFDIQINTEDDIARDDYKPTVCVSLTLQS